MPPLVGIGLTEIPNSGGAKAPPAPPLTTALLSINNSIAKISLYELSRPRFNIGGRMIFELTFKAFRPHDFAF